MNTFWCHDSEVRNAEKKPIEKNMRLKKKKKEKKQLRSFVDREQRLFHLAWAHSRLHAENLLF